MYPRNRSILALAGAFLLLFLISVYRQAVCPPFENADPKPQYLWVYLVYVLLLLVWAYAICSRVMQKHIRVYLLIQDLIMLLWMTVRMVQEVFLGAEDLFLMRFTGYFINIPMVLLPLFALYATLGIGRAEDYKLEKPWYLLLIPAFLLILMALTNEWTHLYCLPADSNLEFPPYIGTYLLILWDLCLLTAHVQILAARNQFTLGSFFLRRVLPFCEPVLLLGFSLPYLAGDFFRVREIIEFSAGIFFIYAASWELYIVAGLIPINTEYERVFACSDIAIQILDDKGQSLAASSPSASISPEQFAVLRDQGSYALSGGRSYHAHKLQRGYFIWQSDRSKLQAAIDALRQTAAELEQESQLYQEEIRIRSKESKIAAQNQIYDQLSTEIAPELRLLEQLLRKCPDSDHKALLLKEICLIGTYVKRRCNLRLSAADPTAQPFRDLRRSFEDVLRCLQELGTETTFTWADCRPLSPKFSLYLLDSFQAILETERFCPKTVSLRLREDGHFFIEVPQKGTFLPPAEGIFYRTSGNTIEFWEEDDRVEAMDCTAKCTEGHT